MLRNGGRGLCRPCYMRRYRQGTLPKESPTAHPNEEARFWMRVKKGPGCWIWTGSKAFYGHGRLTIRGRPTTLAHRFAWELAYGEPPEGNVLHRCGTAACVNPEHLYIGSPRDNSDDRARHGRTANRRNGKHRYRKLSIEDFQAAENALAAGASVRGIARALGVSPMSLSRGLESMPWRLSAGRRSSR